MPSNQLLQAHVAEMAAKNAEATSLGIFTDDREIESKTTEGRLRTKLNDDDEIVHEWYTDSEIKLAGGNAAPTAEEAKATLEELGLADMFEPADSDKQYWQNDAATLVLKYKGVANGAAQLGFDTGMKLIDFAMRHRPDEFDREYQNYELYIRLWWD